MRRVYEASVPTIMKKREAEGGRPGTRTAAGLSPWLVALAFASTTLVKIGDGDLFWHRAAGAWVLAHGRIPHHDPFSYASQGVWRYTEALAQVIYALVHRIGGFEGLVVFGAVTMFALAGLVAQLADGRPGVRSVVVALFGAASYAATSQKPQVFSYLAFAALLLLLRSAESGNRRAVSSIPFLFLAWGYLHRAGTLGLAVLFGTALVAWLPGRRRDVARGLSAATVAATLALALNPGGLFYFTSTVDLASRASFRAYLADWQPLTWTGLTDHHALLLPLLALALVERVRTRRSPDAESVAFVLGLAVAISGARFVPFVAIAAAAPASRALEAGVDALAQRLGAAVRTVLWEVLLLALALGSLLGWILPRVPPGSFGLGVDDALVPVHLAEVVRGVPSRGRLYNSFDFGGYFVHALAPERRVLIDGRNDTVYADAFFAQVIRSQVDPAAFAALSERFDFRVVAIRWVGPGDATGLFLARDPRWALLTWDDRGAVYVRRDSVPTGYLARTAYRELRVDTAFARAASPPRDRTDEADARFVAEVARNAHEAPHSARAWFVAALAYHARGRVDRYLEARSRLETLVRARDLELPIP